MVKTDITNPLIHLLRSLPFYLSIQYLGIAESQYSPSNVKAPISPRKSLHPPLKPSRALHKCTTVIPILDLEVGACDQSGAFPSLPRKRLATRTAKESPYLFIHPIPSLPSWNKPGMRRHPTRPCSLFTIHRLATLAVSFPSLATDSLLFHSILTPRLLLHRSGKNRHRIQTIKATTDQTTIILPRRPCRCIYGRGLSEWIRASCRLRLQASTCLWPVSI